MSLLRGQFERYVYDERGRKKAPEEREWAMYLDSQGHTHQPATLEEDRTLHFDVRSKSPEGLIYLWEVKGEKRIFRSDKFYDKSDLTDVLVMKESHEFYPPKSSAATAGGNNG